MTLRITHLGTGSRGNSTLLETSEVKVLIDQGFSGAQLQKRLAMLNITPEEIDCALISHHHGDHGGGANIAQRKWGMQILANERTAQELDLDPELTSYFGPLDVIRIGDQLSILTIPVPHSSSENVAFVASYGGERAAIITDLGSWTDEFINELEDFMKVKFTNRNYIPPYKKTRNFVNIINEAEIMDEEYIKKYYIKKI